MAGACRDWDKYALDGSAAGGTVGGGGGSSNVGGSSSGGSSSGGSSSGGSGGGVLGECGYINALADDFSDGFKNDAVWSDGAGDGGSCYDTVGSYVIELDADYSEGYFGTESAYDMSDHTLTIDVAELSLSGNQTMWFGVGDPWGDNYVEFTVSGGMLGFGRSVNENYENVAPAVPLDFPTVHFFRLRDTGGTIHYETSSDGVTFNEHASTTATFDLRHSFMEVGADGDGMGGPGLVRIDSVEGGPGAGVLCKTETFSDDFEDGSQNLAWATDEDSLCSQGEVNGRLVVQVAANAAGDDCGHISRHAYDATGSQVSIELVSVPNTAKAWLFVMDPDEEDGVGMGIDAGTLQVVSASDANYVVLTTVVFDPQAHRWLRISEASGTVHFEASPDGQLFSDLHAAPVVVDLTHVTVFMGAGASGLQVNPTTIELDNFNITN